MIVVLYRLKVREMRDVEDLMLCTQLLGPWERIQAVLPTKRSNPHTVS